jgi:hypothetical protein
LVDEGRHDFGGQIRHKSLDGVLHVRTVAGHGSSPDASSSDPNAKAHTSSQPLFPTALLLEDCLDDGPQRLGYVRHLANVIAFNRLAACLAITHLDLNAGRRCRPAHELVDALNLSPTVGNDLGHDSRRALLEGRQAVRRQEPIDLNGAGWWAAMSSIERQVVGVTARSTEPRLSGEIEAEAARRGVQPPTTRQALRRLAAHGHVDRVSDGMRGRYAVSDPLFRRYLELQTCEP